MDFVRSLAEPHHQIRQYVVKNLEFAYLRMTGDERIKVARILFTYYLEVDFDPDKSPK